MHSSLRSLSAVLALGAVPFAAGQLHSISVITPGHTTASTSTLPVSSVKVSSPTGSSVSPSTSSTSASASSSASSVSSTSPSTTPATSPSSTGDPLVLTTIFTQPPDCSACITQIVDWGTEMWQNIINPVPSLTLTSCYPSQFYYSAIATEVLPPYKDLVCPLHWETYQVNATYLICCPSGYGLFAPSYLSTERPGLGAICTSSIWPDELYDITSYDETTVATTIGATAGTDGTLVFATAFDGTLASTIVTSAPSSSASASSSASFVSSSSFLSSSFSSMSTPSSTGFSSSSPSSSPSLSSASSTTASSTITAISQLPTCGQTCFSNLLAQYSALGCSSPDPACVCQNMDFYYGIRDCSNGACGTDVASTVINFESAYCSSALATVTTSAPASTPTAISDLPACGQTCFSNMFAQYSALGCSSADPGCLCQNMNFYYGIRDCSNGACGTDVASTVISFESAYCSSVLATATVPTVTTPAATPTAISDLPACGQTCFSNMLAQYSALGCTSPDPACVCKNINFYFGIRDCSNGACGADVATTVINFESAYCASATATAKAK